jgi:predicted transcriptional regulator
MDSTSFLQDDGQPERRETLAERQHRLASEAAAIAAARASAADGRLISLEAVESWIASLGTDHELPPPKPGQ